jgi:tetratricopeptide (TPR) repeat protein
LLLEKLPFFVLAALSCVVTFIAQQKGDSVVSLEAYPPGLRMANAVVSYALYMFKTIWPSDLAVLYPHPAPGSLPAWQVFGSVLILAAATLAVISAARRYPYLPVGWLWFTGALIPVIGIVQVGMQAMADRYTYIPSIGLFIMAAWGIPEIFKKARHGKQLLAAFSALCILCLLVLTQRQAGYWQDSLTLFDHTLGVTENNYFIHNLRGHILNTRGDYALAIRDFNKAIEVFPGYAEAYDNRGIAYNSTGNYTLAIEDFNTAIRLDAKIAQFHNNRGIAYMALGNPANAIEDFNRAVEIDGRSADAYFNRGMFYQSAGKSELAIVDFDRAIECGHSNKAEVFRSRGIAHARIYEHSKAIEDYDRAIELNPERADLYLNRGVEYGALGQTAQAIDSFSTAIKIDPRYAGAYLNRGAAYGVLGDTVRAIDDYDKAIGINPAHPRAYFSRGMAYASLGKEAQATEDIKKAASLGYKEAINYLKTRATPW